MYLDRGGFDARREDMAADTDEDAGDAHRRRDEDLIIDYEPLVNEFAG